jgi:hypothetical protein
VESAKGTIEVKVWLDDLREPPQPGFAWAKTAKEALELLQTGAVEFIDFDYDLGEDFTGYDVACRIEEWVDEKKLHCPEWAVHSANPVGRDRIVLAMKSAERFDVW